MDLGDLIANCWQRFWLCTFCKQTLNNQRKKIHILLKLFAQHGNFLKFLMTSNRSIKFQFKWLWASPSPSFTYSSSPMLNRQEMKSNLKTIIYLKVGGYTTYYIKWCIILSWYTFYRSFLIFHFYLNPWTIDVYTNCVLAV